MSKPTKERLRCVRCGYPRPTRLTAEDKCPVCGSRFGDQTPPARARLRGAWKIPMLYMALGGVFLVLFMCILGLVVGGGSTSRTPTPVLRTEAIALQQPSDTPIPPASTAPAPTATDAPTEAPPTATGTATVIVPSATPEPSATATQPPTKVPPTATATKVPPTATATNVPPTATVAPTNTPKPTDTLQPTSTPIPAPTATWRPAEAKTMFVSAGGDGVYIRSEPDLAARIRVWPDATELTVLGQEGEWYYVQAPDGYLGFMPAKYLSAMRPATPTVVVRAQEVPVAPAPSGYCCKHCGPNSKPCGNSCISLSKNCHQPPGCACY